MENKGNTLNVLLIIGIAVLGLFLFLSSSSSSSNSSASVPSLDVKEASKSTGAPSIDIPLHTVLPHQKVRPTNLDSGLSMLPFTINKTTGLLDPPSFEEWEKLTREERHQLFQSCIHQQADLVVQRMPVDEVPLPKLRQAVTQKLAQQGRQVVALLYYGRRRYVRILLPYLKRNLRQAGGIIDRVIICMSTSDFDDREYANAVLRQPGFEIFEPPPNQPLMEQWLNFWNTLRSNTSAIYIKLDDDLVFIEDGAFEWLVYEKLRNGQYIALSANIINHSQLAYLHQRMGLLKGMFEYYGRVTGKKGISQHMTFLKMMESTWNATGSYATALQRYHFDWWDQSICLCDGPQAGAAPQDGGLPFCNKRGHYRWSINMFVVEAADIVKPAQQQDELFFSNYLPTVVGNRHTAVVGRAIAVHGLYHSQRVSVSEDREQTLWLKRYTDLAKSYCAIPFPSA